MKFTINLLFVLMLYFLSICRIEYCYAASTNTLSEHHPNRVRILSKYRYKVLPQYTRLKPEAIFNDFVDDEDFIDLSKRQQSQSPEDYGYLRYGKRDEQFEDYGHIRFGRNGLE